MAVVAFVKRENNMLPSHPCSVKAGDEFYLVIDGEKGATHIARSDAVPILDQFTREVVDWKIDIEEPLRDAR